MSQSRPVHALMHIDRPSGEIEVHVVGRYYPARAGRKAHPMDRFAEPDEPAEVADIAAETAAGEITLTDAEMATADGKLMEAAERE